MGQTGSAIIMLALALSSIFTSYKLVGYFLKFVFLVWWVIDGLRLSGFVDRANIRARLEAEKLDRD